MSGPFGSSQWMYASGGFYPYQIEQSLRFNDDDSAYLSRTPAGAGNRKTWTWSGWVKRCDFGTNRPIWSAYTDANNRDIFQWDSARLQYVNISGGSANTNLNTTALFRDTSAWYHVVLAVDTTQATSTNRIKIYVNGTQQTDFIASTYPSQNTDMMTNNNVASYLGREVNGGQYAENYLAEVNFIDGTALDPTSFGETKSGIWVPKAYDGAYGTNGFYLSFADSAAIGDDLSGNGNDWTANNLVATDVLLDSPTNNYAVLNPLDKNASLALSDGNLAFQASTTAAQGVRSTFAIPAGVKIYAECSFPTWTTGSANYAQFGIYTSTASTSGDIGNSSGTGFSIEANQLTDTQLRLNGSSVSVAGAVASSDVFQIAVDLDNLKVWLGKNNTWYNSSGGTDGDPATGANPTGTLSAGVIYFPAAAKYGTANSHICNFGQSAFAYTPPTDFLPLNTANLPDPVIDPAQDDVPADYFNTVLYSGNNGTQSITGVGFSPDWLWIKVRNEVNSHYLFDQIRGADQALFSDSTSNEIDYSATGRMTSFDSDGFTVEYSSSTGTNASGDTYVAWNWLAGNGTSSNTDGSITSTVSVNQKAGFSVVSYTGTRTSAGNDTIGHGLGKAPSVVISKARNATGRWVFQHSSLGADDYLELNTTSASADSVSAGAGSLPKPTSSVFYGSYLFGLNVNGENCIAYCFAEVEGYSKFGSYTGNSSADGPFVWCGFRPAFLLYKRSDGTNGWAMLDTTREAENVMGDINLFPENSGAEVGNSNYYVDFLSNGFKPRTADDQINISGGTYIFMAFAESPFKYANAR
jgi:hypothetical protein